MCLLHRAGTILPMNDAGFPTLVVERFPARRPSLRIAVVTETWPPEVNGVAMSIARVVAGLQRRDHDIQLVRPRQRSDDGATGDRRVLDAVLTRGLPIPLYPQLRLGIPEKRTLVKLWSERRPDVVHLATEGPLGWSALHAALHLRIPVSSDFRTNFHAYSGHYGVGWLRGPISAYLRKFHNRTRLTMVPTEALRNDLSKLGFRNLHVVARGVDLGHFHPMCRSDALRASWGATADDLIVVCVGRLAPEKNLDLLLGAFDAIRRVVTGARLVLVGDGPMRGQLAATRPDVILAGQREGEDLSAHYASADLFLFPSLTETFGNVTVEAMASGLPVVAFDYAAAAQLIIDGDNGRKARFGDAAAFRAISAELAADLFARERHGRRARAAVTSLTWDEVILRFESLLLAAAGEGDVPSSSGHTSEAEYAVCHSEMDHDA
jgi:glycosyltransferase involved in cell wall biosynthesis